MSSTYTSRAVAAITQAARNEHGGARLCARPREGPRGRGLGGGGGYRRAVPSAPFLPLAPQDRRTSLIDARPVGRLRPGRVSGRGNLRLRPDTGQVVRICCQRRMESASLAGARSKHAAFCSDLAVAQTPEIDITMGRRVVEWLVKAAQPDGPGFSYRDAPRSCRLQAQGACVVQVCGSPISTQPGGTCRKRNSSSSVSSSSPATAWPSAVNGLSGRTWRSSPHRRHATHPAHRSHR